MSRFGRVQPQRLQKLPIVLQKLIQNSNRLDYVGEREVKVKVRAVFTTHIEDVTRQGSKTRIDFPSDSPFAGQILLNVDGKRLHYFPKNGVIRIMPGFKDDILTGLLRHPKALLANQVQVQNGGRVAGIPVDRVDLYDRQHRLRQELWIDPRNGALLGRAGFAPNGMALASFQFLSINYHPHIAPNAFELPKGAKVFNPNNRIINLAKRLKLAPFRIPDQKGIQLLNCRKIVLKGQPVLMEIYNGPQGRISYFEVNTVLSGTGNGPDEGGVHSAKRIMGQETIFLVGRYPVKRLQDLLQTVRRI